MLHRVSDTDSDTRQPTPPHINHHPCTSPRARALCVRPRSPSPAPCQTMRTDILQRSSQNQSQKASTVVRVASGLMATTGLTWFFFSSWMPPAEPGLTVPSIARYVSGPASEARKGPTM